MPKVLLEDYELQAIKTSYSDDHNSNSDTYISLAIELLTLRS